MKLVKDYKQAHKWFSVRGLALLAAAPVLYESFPAMQEYLSPTLFHSGMGVLAFLTIFGRLVKQG
jgi:hypothetical protein